MHGSFQWCFCCLWHSDWPSRMLLFLSPSFHRVLPGSMLQGFDCYGSNGIRHCYWRNILVLVRKINLQYFYIDDKSAIFHVFMPTFISSRHRNRQHSHGSSGLLWSTRWQKRATSNIGHYSTSSLIICLKRHLCANVYMNGHLDLCTV